MNAQQLRRLAITDPEAFRRQIAGARKRDLAARHLLLHPHHIATASQEALAALSEYMADRRWRSLYFPDRRMYRFLRSGAERLQQLARSHGKSPATASEARKTPGIPKSQVAKILRTFIAAGVKV